MLYAYNVYVQVKNVDQDTFIEVMSKIFKCGDDLEIFEYGENEGEFEYSNDNVLLHESDANLHKKIKKMLTQKCPEALVKTSWRDLTNIPENELGDNW